MNHQWGRSGRWISKEDAREWKKRLKREGWRPLMPVVAAGGALLNSGLRKLALLAGTGGGFRKLLPKRARIHSAAAPTREENAERLVCTHDTDVSIDLWMSPIRYSFSNEDQVLYGTKGHTHKTTATSRQTKMMYKILNSWERKDEHPTYSIANNKIQRPHGWRWQNYTTSPKPHQPKSLCSGRRHRND